MSRDIKDTHEQARPAVIWLTGLSGAGKTTIADCVYEELQKLSLKAERLDGDAIRNILPTTGFSREERDAHVRRVGYLASRLEHHGVFVVAALISPFEDSRRFVRGLCKNFIEVYVSTPLATCERRDPKKLYVKARKGEIQHFTGVSDPYDAPSNPELTIDTTSLSIEEAVERVMKVVRARCSLE